MLNLSKENKYWLAGLLEGEGSFCKGPPSSPRAPRVGIQMTDKDIVEKVAGLFGCKCIFLSKQKANWHSTYVARRVGKKAVELMQILKPLMGKRRQEQIQRALNCYKPKPHGVKLVVEQVREIKKRFSCGETTRELAKDFGVSISTTRAIVAKRTWKFV